MKNNGAVKTGRSDFQARRQRRVERMRERAESKRREAERLSSSSDALANVMNGQPVLVGHHSEKRHRRDLERLNRSTGRIVELSGEAEELERRADSAERNRAISSDDPDAIVKLKSKIDALEAERERYKKVNRMIRAGRWDELAEKERESLQRYMRFSPARVIDKKGVERPFYEQYVLSNIGNNIRAAKKRLDKLHALAALESESWRYGEIVVHANRDENRVQIKFPGKPSDEIRAELKRDGFRWSPGAGVWQRLLNSYAVDVAKRLAQKFAD